MRAERKLITLQQFLFLVVQQIFFPPFHCGTPRTVCPFSLFVFLASFLFCPFSAVEYIFLVCKSQENIGSWLFVCSLPFFGALTLFAPLCLFFFNLCLLCLCCVICTYAHAQVHPHTHTHETHTNTHTHERTRAREHIHSCAHANQFMWTPEEPWETLDKDVLYLDYPKLMPL